jgi:hypothetical protein
LVGHTAKYPLQVDSSVFEIVRQTLSARVNFVDHLEDTGIQESLFSVYDEAISRVRTRIQAYENAWKQLDTDEVNENDFEELFNEISQILDKLSIIQLIFEEQEDVWNSFTQSEPSKPPSHGSYPPEMSRFIRQMQRRREGLKALSDKFWIFVKHKSHRLNYTTDMTKGTWDQRNIVSASILVVSVIVVVFIAFRKSGPAALR